jgi:DNA-binding SARP family transcriptional activator/Tfp pilus assembly protein PilF
MRLELGILGAISARVDGRPIDLGPPKQRWVLAALLADANTAVTLDQLADRVWGERQPDSARLTLRSYLSRLRVLFSDAATGSCAIRRDGTGYVVAVADESAIDLHDFRRLLAQARASHDAGEAAERYERALGRWRGEEALAGMDTPWAAVLRATLDAERFAARLEQHEARLRGGEHTALLPGLATLAAEHPLDERLAGQFLLALYRDGRQADALAHYDRTRRRLADELGVDPGPTLRRLHRHILTADPVLGPSAGGPRLVPAQLPADSAVFAGRRTELDRILALHAARAPAAAPAVSAVVISAIDGMAGVGKTALAVRAAHRLAPDFPDGQFFLDLHGYTHGVEPVEPLAALEAMLRALGVPGESIPPGLDERAALYRTQLARTRTLIILDNAADESQVVPLLPAAPGCLVIITSRQRLIGIDDAQRLSLDVLPRDDAVALFADAADPLRLASEPPERVAEVVELCGRLPLALRIAAARLSSRPTWTLSHLAERLGDHRHRPSELQAGRRSVYAALGLSYRHLTPGQRRTYRLLGLNPGTDIDAHAAAALTGDAVRQSLRLLDDLVDAHLLAEPAPGRYRFHDLVRAHATATAAAEDTAADRRSALGRLLDHYAHAASAAMDAVYAHETGQRPDPPPSATPVPDFGAPGRAESWLDTELDNLLTAATHAAARDRRDHAVHQSATLHRHLRTRGRYGDALALHQHALDGARAAGDPGGELTALNRLGDIHYLQDRYEQAADCFERALEAARALGDRTGERTALTGLGHVHRQLVRDKQAEDCFGRALDLARAAGDRHGELYALHGLGHVHATQGQFEQAADCFGRALELARATGDRNGEQSVLTGFGSVHRHLGRYDRAADCYERALGLARATGNHNGELYALHGLGHACGALGRYERAMDSFGRALELARASGDRHGETYALHGLGDVHRMRGEHGEAAGHYARLLRLARATGDRNGQFEAHDGLGRCRHAAGDDEQALAHHRTALALATDLGQPHDECRAHDGLAHAHQALGDVERARRHWRAALDILTHHGRDYTWDPQVTAAALRARLGSLDGALAEAEVDRAPQG